MLSQVAVSESTGLAGLLGWMGHVEVTEKAQECRNPGVPHKLQPAPLDVQAQCPGR